MHIITQGLVLRETNYKEADKILTVLTAEGGKRTVKARACRRKGSPLAAAAQLLTWSDMTLFEYRDYYTLNEASTREEFRGLRNDLEKLALGSYFAEVTEAVAEEGVPQPTLLSLILNCLYALDKWDKPPALVKAAFELRALCAAGYEPCWTPAQCAVCPSPKGAAQPLGGSAPLRPLQGGSGGGHLHAPDRRGAGGHGAMWSAVRPRSCCPLP